MMNRSQIEKMLMASGGITGEPVQTARFGSYMRSTGGGKSPRRVTQGTTSGGGSSTQRKSVPNIKQGKAESQLNNLVIKSRNDERYRNEQGAGMNYGTAYELAPKAAKDFVNRQLEKTGGRLNEAAKARIAPYLTDRTAYQLDLNRFRNASPENEAAYVKRFPKTAAFEKILNSAAEGIVGVPGKIIKKAADTYLDGVKNMIDKVSGVDAKNVEIAKNKDSDINTIVNNLQRNIKEEREEGKARGMSEADLTAMYGDPIDVETGDDIFGGDLIGMDLLEEDSPLRTDNVPGTFVSPDQRVPTPIRETRTEEPGDETVADQPQFTPIRLDRTVGDEGLFDLTGSDREGETSVFDLDPDRTYRDAMDDGSPGGIITPSRQEAERQIAALNVFSPGVTTRALEEGFFDDLVDETFNARDTGFPNIDVTQERRDFVNNPIEGQAVVAGQGLVNADGSPIMDRTAQGTALTGEPNPTPLFDSDIDEEAILRAIEGKANGGQVFGNQNMSTFDKLKAIADGIADNK